MTDTNRTRILLVDDHRMVAESMVRVLGAAEDLTVVAVASTSAEGLRAAVDTSPDVVLMDYRLPDEDGIEATRRMRAALPDVKVLILTGHAEPAVLRDAIEAGACGLVPKTAGWSELLEAVRLAAAGAMVAPDLLLRRALAVPEGSIGQLTPREFQVLQLLEAGRSNREISLELHLSLNTVRNHVQHVLDKLGAHSKHEAVAIARRQGVLRPIG